MEQISSPETASANSSNDHKNDRREVEMDPYFRQLLSSPDDFRLTMDVFSRITGLLESRREESNSQLSEEHQVVFDVVATEGALGSRGFEALFFQPRSDFRTIARSYEEIGINRAAKAVQRAIAVFPSSSPPASRRNRIDFLDNIDDHKRDELKKCTREVLAVSRQSNRALAAYIRRNALAFVELEPSPREDLNELRRRNLPFPAVTASEKELVNWLNSIDVRFERTSEFKTCHFAEHTSLPRSGNPIVSVKLSYHRHSTDAEIQHMARLAALHEIREIRLDETFITPAGLRELPKFSSLHILGLRETDVEDNWLTFLQSIPELRVLDLSKTKITDNGLNDVARLARLEKLNLDATKVTDAGVGLLTDMSQLKSIDLSHTNVNGAGLNAMADAELEEVDFMGAKVTDEGLKVLRNFKNLTSLGLRDTAIGNLTLEHIASCKKLKYLNLDSTLVTDRGLEYLAGLTSMKSLDLHHTSVNGRGFGHLNRLARLTRLSLYGTHFNDAGMDHLKHLTALNQLTLSNTKITDKGLSSLVGLCNLEHLSISGTTPIKASREIRTLESLTSLKYITLPAALKNHPNVKYLQRKLPNTKFSFY